MLMRISATHLFVPRRILAHEISHQADALKMLNFSPLDAYKRGFLVSGRIKCIFAAFSLSCFFWIRLPLVHAKVCLLVGRF
jgi:hypothetical protein